MLKLALLDCKINEKCCSVGGGTGHLLFFFRPHPGGFDRSRVPTPGICYPRQKKC